MKKTLILSCLLAMIFGATVLLSFKNPSKVEQKIEHENSTDFSKRLTAYKKALPNETNYYESSYSTDYLTKCITLVNAANDAIDAIKTPGDYVTFLEEVNFEKHLPKETLWPGLAEADTGSEAYQMQYQYQPEVRKNYYLIKELTMAYMMYKPKFAKNKFTKESVVYTNGQIKKAEVFVSSDGDLWSTVSVKKNLNSYSDYELYIINYFCFDIFDAVIGFENEDVQKVAARLNASKYSVYKNLGDDILDLLDQ